MLLTAINKTGTVEAPEKEILKFNDNMKFDVILANPPYDNGLHEKFSIKYFDICDGQICWVSPLSFLFGKRQNKKLTVHLDKYATDIEQINGNEYFDAAIGGTMGIVYVDMDIDNQGVTFDGKEYEKCSEITRFSNDELLNSIKQKIGCTDLKDNVHIHICREPNTKDFVNQPIITKPNPEWWVVGFCALRGHRGTSDFYTIVSNNKKELNKRVGQYKDVSKVVINVDDKRGNFYKKHALEYYIPFNTKQEHINFLNYICTDFVRICLYMIKTNMQLARGELKYVPWQDFTEEWDDEKLFKKYGITKEEIQHIYGILPNYYGIERINLDEYEL